MSKGASLPIHTMVYLAIAIVVLLAMVAFFMRSTGPTAAEQAAGQDFRNCCIRYVFQGCLGSPSDFTCALGGDEKSLSDWASAAGVNDDDSVRRACQCTGSGGGQSIIGLTLNDFPSLSEENQKAGIGEPAGISGTGDPDVITEADNIVKG